MLAYLAGNAGSAWSYVDPAWGHVGLSWRLCGPILRPLSADREAYVGPCWPVRSQKIRKMGTAKKHCKTQDILRVDGLSWGYVGPSWGLCWPILGLCWPILELCWPILGLCWPVLRPMLAHLGAMLAHLEPYVGPSWATRSEKWQKVGRAQNTVKRGGFWRHQVVGSRGCHPSLLRRGENRLRLCHGQGAPGRS